MLRLSLPLVATFTAFLTLCAGFVQAAPFRTLYRFGQLPDGNYTGSVTLVDIDHTLYGTTYQGGSANLGVIYSFDRLDRVERILYNFGGSMDGGYPVGGLTNVGGLLFGTTEIGGANNEGTVFSFDPTTAIKTTIYNFGAGSNDGMYPRGKLVHQGDFLYGITQAGGAYRTGAVFSLNVVTRAEAVLHSFSGADGSSPNPVILQNGILYGTTGSSGGFGYGAVFAINAATGTETILYSFTGKNGDGANPYSTVTYHDGLLYGTTFAGGLLKCQGNFCGTAFSVDAVTGKETVLHAFTDPIDGMNPEAPLIFKDGFLFGTTARGGLSGLGSIFSLNPRTGRLKQLYAFDNANDGAHPGTLLYRSGKLYGLAAGGKDNNGTIFRFTP